VSGGTPGEPIAFNAADVRPEKVRWLWPRYIPDGKVTVLDGDPDRGKSTFTMDLAARVSTRSPMPDGSRSEADNRGVVIINGEDGAADTLVPRLLAAGADRKAIEFLDAVWQTDEKGKLYQGAVTVGGGLPAIKEMIERTQAALVVIDPLPAFLDEGINSYRDSDIRRALFPLSRLAELTGVAVILVRHLNKQTGGSALYRGGGSIGIIGAARSGLLIAADPDDETRRVLAVTKSNLARKPAAQAFRLVPDQLYDCARIAWEGPTKHRPDDLLGAPGNADADETAAVAGACQWLTDLLAENEPWGGKEPWAKQVRDEAASDRRFGWRTVQKAAARISVDSHHVGKPGDKEQGWKWRLPAGKSPGHAQERTAENGKRPGHAQERTDFSQERTDAYDKSPGHAQERTDPHIYNRSVRSWGESPEEAQP
jgi:hypothetical protein